MLLAQFGSECLHPTPHWRKKIRASGTAKASLLTIDYWPSAYGDHSNPYKDSITVTNHDEVPGLPGGRRMPSSLTALHFACQMSSIDDKWNTKILMGKSQKSACFFFYDLAWQCNNNDDSEMWRHPAIRKSLTCVMIQWVKNPPSGLKPAPTCPSVGPLR
jgi:hypothetical protein